MPVDKVSIEKFAQSIKEKYPQYKDVNDTLLTNSIIEKYPQYKGMIDFNAKSTVTPQQATASQPSLIMAQSLRDLNTQANKPVIQDVATAEDVGAGGPQSDQGQAVAKESFDKGLKDFSTKLGVEPEHAQKAIFDFPQISDEGHLKELATLSKDNPVKYDRLSAADKNRQMIANSGIPGAIHAANDYNHLQDQQDHSQLINNINTQKEIINTTLSGDQRTAAHANLEREKAPLINSLSTGIQKDYQGSKYNTILDQNQYAGLEELKIFRPEFYDQIVKELDQDENIKKETPDISVGYHGSQNKEAVKADAPQLLGLEVVKKSLSDIGRHNLQSFLQEKAGDLEQQYKSAQTEDEKDAIKQQYTQIKANADALEQDKTKDDERYPRLASMKLDEAVREQTNHPQFNPLEYGIYKFAKGIENTGETAENLFTGLFAGKDTNTQLAVKRLGEGKLGQHESFLPTKLRPNDNLFSKATLYSNAGMIGDITSIAAQSAALGGAGTGKLLSAAIPMFTTSQNEFYKEALAEGDPNPMAKANVNALIMSAAGMINPDLNIVKRSLGANTVAGKALAGIDESTWKSVIENNKPLLKKIQNSLTSTAKEAAKLGAVYGAGTSIARDLANKGLFNENISGEDIINHAVQATKDLALSSIALLGVHAISNFKDVSPQQKGAIWEAGQNPDFAIEAIDEAARKGEIPQAIADLRKQAVKDISGLINKVPTESAKGKPLSDKDRIDYLYNIIVNKKARKLAEDLPEAQKEEVTHTALVADYKNNLILEPKTDAQLESRKRKLESDLEPPKQVEGEKAKEKLTDKEKASAKAELEAINDILERKVKQKENASRISVIQPNENTAPNIIEPKRTSVIMPGEIKQPETITIKPQDNAIQQRQPETLGAHGNGPEGVGGQSESSGMGSSEQRNESTGESNPKEIGQSPGEEEVNPDELPFTGRTSETVGIAHGSVTKRATEAPILPPERGQGVTVEEAVQHGRNLLAMGEDADKAAKEFQADKKISYDALSLVRAKHAELAKATNEAADKFGDNSPQAKEAGKIESQWYKEVVKPMQTEWSKIGQTQQGETDIDTGTVTGLRRAYQEQTGKDFTPEQAAKAKELTEQVKTLTDKVSKLEKKLTEAHEKETSSEPEAKTIKEKAKKAADWIRKGKSSPPGSFSAVTPASLVWDGMVEAAAKIIEAGGTIAEAIDSGIKHLKDSDWYKGLSADKQKDAIADFEEHINGNNPDLAQRFANKKDNKFNPQDAKDIWEYAKKEYLDKGTNYVDTINNTSKDLGLTPEQVRNAITQPKGTRVISDEIYIQQAKRTDAINEAKRWVKTNNQPKLIKFFKGLPRFFFAAKVFGHGTVGMITHAGTNIFRPTAWKTYWPNFIRQFKYAFGGLTKEGLANYNKAMEDLKNDPQFIFWKRSGLAVDPKETYDEYQGAGKIFGKINAIGDRGFNALKVYRMDMAKMFYDRLSNVEKADPETAKEIAKIVNHSTGTSEVKIPKWTTTVFFAPKLEAARWQGLITDPAKAANTFVNWKKATPAEKVQAKIVARKAGEIMATWAAALAANAGYLALTGSSQRVNFNDPTSSDWLKFKGFDKTLDVSGGMEATMRFIATLMHTGYLAYTGTKQELRDKPQDKDYKKIGQQARYKLSPFMSTVMDFATGTDAMGRPLPGSKVKPPAGVEPYTWKSYVFEQQLPIPIAEGIKGTIESMKARGMDDAQIKDILTGITVGAISGGTGAKVGPDYSMMQQTPEQKKTATTLTKWKDELNIKDKTILPTDIQYDHSTPKPSEEQTAELNEMVKASRQKLFELVQKDLDWGKMSDSEKKVALETVMKEGEDAGKETFKAKYPQFTPKRPEMTDAEREKLQKQSEKERDIQRAISNKARGLK